MKNKSGQVRSLQVRRDHASRERGGSGLVFAHTLESGGPTRRGIAISGWDYTCRASVNVLFPMVLQRRAIFCGKV